MANPLTKIPKFRRCVLQNFPFIEQDFDALTDYQLLCKVVEYLNKVISSQNEVIEITESLMASFNELQSFVENYFDNLDVQDEINNKLDAYVQDGTMQRLIESIIIDDSLNPTSTNPVQNAIITEKVNELESKDSEIENDMVASHLQSSIQHVAASPVATAQKPDDANAYVQSMAYDRTNNNWFIVWAGSNNTVIIQKYTENFSTLIDSATLSAGHGNSLCWCKGNLYLCDYDNASNVYVIDPSTLTISKTLTMPIQVRSFAINTNMGDTHNVVIALQNRNSVQTRFYTLLHNGDLNFSHAILSDYLYCYRNGTKMFRYHYNTNNTYGLYAQCYGNNTIEDNNRKGNVIDFNLVGSVLNFRVAVNGMGRELQDIEQKNDYEQAFYVINSDGAIYSILPNLIPDNSIGDFLAGSTKDYLPRALYGASKTKTDAVVDPTQIVSFTSGSATNKVIKEFYIPYRTDTMLGCFEAGGQKRSIACYDGENSNIPGNIYVPIDHMHKFTDNKLYIVSGYVKYVCSQVNVTNLFGESQTEIRCYMDANTSIDVGVAILNTDNTWSYERFQTWGALETYCENRGFITRDIYPMFLKETGYVAKGSNATSRCNWFDS